MSKSRVGLVAVAAIAAAIGPFGATEPSGSSAALLGGGLLRLPPAAPAGQFVLFGHIKSLTRARRRFVLRFDPALFLTGATANRAAVEDKVISPGDAVPNDSYTLDESHRVLMYFVPPSAHVTVITNGGTNGLASTPITVAELAQIMKGGNPRHRPLFDRARGLGFWVRVAIDTVRSLDQQYHP
jgi:hypothetical protein